MHNGISKTHRRILVIVNYASIVLVLLFFYLGEKMGWKIMLAVGESIMIIIATISFIILQIKTKLWNMVHAKIDKLDERQIQITYESLRHSYSVFSILCLVIMYIIALTAAKGMGMLGVLIPASLLYLAHTLPSSFIAWTEKEI